MCGRERECVCERERECVLVCMCVREKGTNADVNTAQWDQTLGKVFLSIIPVFLLFLSFYCYCLSIITPASLIQQSSRLSGTDRSKRCENEREPDAANEQKNRNSEDRRFYRRSFILETYWK